MPYHDYIHKISLLDLDLLDSIPYKYVKLLLETHDDYDDVNCVIKDIPNEKEGWTTTQFKFKLDYEPCANGQVLSKKFKIKIEYTNSSAIASKIMETLWWDEPDDSESEPESESEEEKDIQ